VRVETGWVETAAERRCARTAPCIGNEHWQISRGAHLPSIIQLPVPLAALQLLGLPFRAKVAAIRTYPATSLARFPTVVIPCIPIGLNYANLQS